MNNKFHKSLAWDYTVLSPIGITLEIRQCNPKLTK